jgi:hypothetical protein
MIMNGEKGRTYKEAVMAYFKVLPQYSQNGKKTKLQQAVA